MDIKIIDTSVRDRFVHQFAIGPEFLEDLSGWQFLSIDSEHKLSAHPELNIEKVEAGNKSITLVGYILDPNSYKASNNEILLDLLNNFTTIDQLILATSRMGGRWILIADSGDQKILFHDAMGLRQVFYTTPEFTQGKWIVSQPGILSSKFDLQIDEDAQTFIDSFEFRNHTEYRWPAYATAFREIRHLLPNHRLDLNTFKISRYWPNENIESITVDEGIETISHLLQGIIKAAHHRFDIVYGVTAGIDSRIMLAASREVKDKVEGITVRQGRMNDDHQDLVIPEQLLGKFGMPYTIIYAQPYMTADFSKFFKDNVFFAHDIYGPDAEAILKQFSRSKFIITGSGVEVARNGFMASIDPEQKRYSAENLSRLQHFGDNKFAVDHLNQWLEGLGDLKNVHLLDLYAWEQSHGNWLASTQLEFDCAWQDILSPYNCRDVLITSFATGVKYRTEPEEHRMFTMLIEKMWPELLQEPINPDKKQKYFKMYYQRIFMRKIKRFIKNILNIN